MSVNLQQTIQEQIRVLSEDEMQRVLNFMNNLRKEKKLPESLGELIDECFKDLPTEVLDELPADASANLDQYLYGAPKK
ncbi:hypothetical protein BH20ACI1_BH20ACI1_28660 [soil metagenome]